MSLSQIISRNYGCKSIIYHLLPRTLSHNYSKAAVSSGKMKITVCGAAGNTGQYLSFLLKQSSLIDEIALYDVCTTESLAMELNLMDTKALVTSYMGKGGIQGAYEGAKIVVCIASTPGSANLSNSEKFNANKTIVHELTNHFAAHSSDAFLVIATQPTNSLLPLACEVLTRLSLFNPRKVFGVSTLNNIRANTFASDILGYYPEEVTIPVIGGCSNKSVVPLLSRAKPCSNFTENELEELTLKIQNAHEDLVKAKFKQAPYLSTAYGVNRFLISLIKGIQGASNIVDYAYVNSDVLPTTNFIATALQLGPSGIQKNLGVPDISEYENCLLMNAIDIIANDLKMAEEYLKSIAPCDKKP